MKRIFIYLALVISIGALSSCTVRAVVHERPREIVYERPPPPSREHIWITGDWVWVGGRYQCHEGHRERHRPMTVWETGHWPGPGRSERWTPGHCAND